MSSAYAGVTTIVGSAGRMPLSPRAPVRARTSAPPPGEGVVLGGILTLQLGDEVVLETLWGERGRLLMHSFFSLQVWAVQHAGGACPVDGGGERLAPHLILEPGLEL